MKTGVDVISMVDCAKLFGLVINARVREREREREGGGEGGRD